MDKIDQAKEDFGINFERIIELISKYEQIKKSGEIKKYNEESTKKDFILPLFKALGWNVDNRGKSNDSVSAEETISKKRVDYGFRISGIPQFFLEAKSLKEENIQTNSKYVIQAIDYAWMKSCSWAILCNFETIAVYNADWKESNYGNNLFFVLHPNDFLTDKRFIYLSKKAFENNELDKIASRFGKKQLKNPINKQLLQDMIHFREVLSKDIVKNNQDKRLTQDDIDESVQRILDRLIFIRNAEDRGLEENQLQSIIRQWYSRGKGHLLKEISRIYADYDKNYNSKLFAHHLCDDLYIDNEALQEVIEGLNHSKDNSYRYDFSIIESDVLGNIYEQYLGNILKSTPKRAKLEESKTHRKEQGIYYTPSYIVDYIVKNTVGEFIKTHTPEEIKKVRILDPACGSGSFLIRAYKELENYWKQNSDFAQTTLDSEEFYSKKVDILKNNIFGVDLDPKAVEIAQLNLLLQISERKQRLPILQNNIKVGNSLIDDPSISDRAFKWEEEFPIIIKEGGFDIVIGNPPYVRIQNLGEKDIEYFNRTFKSAFKNYDIYLLFVEKSLKLYKKNGIIGFIIPSKFVNADYGSGLRNLISETKSLYKLLDFKDIQIFGDATNYTCVLFLKNSKNEDFYYLFPKSKETFTLQAVSNIDAFHEYKLQIPEPNHSWILSDNRVSELLKKLSRNAITLGDIAKNIFQGLTTSADSIYFVRVESETKDTVKIRNIEDNLEFIVEKEILKKLLKGKDIKKWSMDWKGYYVVFPYLVKGGKAFFIPLSEIKERYPLAYGYFKYYESKLKSRENNRLENDDNWHQYIYRKNLEKFEQPKIITQVLASNNTFAIDDEGEYYFVGGGNAGGYGIVLREEYKDYYFYVLALLNSKVLEFYLKNISTPFRGGYFSYGKRFIEQLPIVLPSNPDVKEVTELSRTLVEKHKYLKSRGDAITDEVNKVMTEVKSLTEKLDNTIYGLYELSSNEVKTIEEFINGK
ncbi:MAG TPA: N-6 DNA methylase [Thermoplasmataceae archaeon]|nr:N-6 DNA methylase [Thermoplasmataceae archaeon]